MTDDLKLHKDKARGFEAETFLNSPVCKNAFAHLEAEYIAFLRNSKPTEREAREEAYHALRSLDKLREDIRAVIANGKLAERQLSILDRFKI